MSRLRELRLRAGAAVYDWPRFEAALRGIGPYRRLPAPWIAIHNRSERITLDGRGARCEWLYTTDLHIAKVFPSAGARLMRRAFRDWPIALRDAPPPADAPAVTFIIGHRGLARLPHLLMTLRSIAGQTGVPVECIVVEQSAAKEIESALPPWVRYVHTPVDAQYAYNRSWTLNVGARLARGEVLILHDNDMLSPARYAAETLARAREGWSFLELKRFTFYLGEEETDRVFASGEVRTDVPANVVQNLQGASIAVSKEAFAAIGGFDESFVGWGGEDNEFWERAETTGRVYGFGSLPFLHLWHAPQKGKLAGDEAPAVRRYFELRSIPPAERIRALTAREQGSLLRPAHG
ncbi:MAG TPA: galactosyltransferase-related protein [Thermoanaerobaculia bacterium]